MSAIPYPAADRAQIGDWLDPQHLTEDLMPDDPAGCGSENGIPCCTRQPHDVGQHVATAFGGLVVAVWPADPTRGDRDD